MIDNQIFTDNRKAHKYIGSKYTLQVKKIHVSPFQLLSISI